MLLLLAFFYETHTKVKSLQRESCTSAASVRAVEEDGNLPVGFVISAARSVLEDMAARI